IITFDPEALNLHLAVGTANDNQLTLRRDEPSIPHHVQPGAVGSVPARHVPERGLTSISQVPSRYRRKPADTYVADYAPLHEGAVGTDDVYLNAPDGRPGMRSSWDRRIEDVCGDDLHFGRSIMVLDGPLEIRNGRRLGWAEYQRLAGTNQPAR